MDGEAFILEVLHEMLTALGYHVETAEGANSALDRLRKGPGRYDLIVADLTLPQMNGRQLSSQIMNLAADLPIILCTGTADCLEPFNVDIPSVKALLPKPIQSDRPAGAVRKMLDGKD